jgi:hypothetical protein
MAALGIILSIVDCDEHAEFEPSMLKNSPDNYRAVRQRVAAKGGRWRAWTLSKRRRRQIARKAGLASAAKRREERLRSARCAKDRHTEPYRRSDISERAPSRPA